jgi:hypothetical protein
MFNSATPENRKLLWRQDLRIIPISAFIYLLCYLDRSNIGNARIMNLEEGDDLETELGINDDKYIISLMVFLISWALFEVPSNYFLKLVTPSVWKPCVSLVSGSVLTDVEMDRVFDVQLGCYHYGHRRRQKLPLVFGYPIPTGSFRGGIVPGIGVLPYVLVPVGRAKSARCAYHGELDTRGRLWWRHCLW